MGDRKMKTIKPGFLAVMTILIFSLSDCNTEQPTGTEEEPMQTAGQCDQNCLESFVDRYIDAMVSHDPSSIPLAKDVKFTENGVELAVGDALWATASANTDYRIYVTDPETGQVGYSGIVEENGTPVLISFRLKIVNGKINEIEQIVGRDRGFSGIDSLKEPDPIYAQVLKPSERTGTAIK
jgi:hypothetical protein